MIIGLTGGIGSGKSTVAEMFRELGIPVYDSDVEAKVLMNTSKKIKNKIITLLGNGAYENGDLNRTYISERVFKDKVLLAKLNRIVHPAVKEHFMEWRVKQNTPYLIQETALIFENNTQDNYDRVILVTAPVDIRVTRVVARDKTTKNKVLTRISNQMNDSEKITKSHYVIQNISLEDTKEKVKSIHKELLLQVQ